MKMHDWLATLSTPPGSYTVVWLAIAFVAGTIEVMVTSFVFLLISLSALVGAILAAFRVPFEIQVIIFALDLIMSLIFVRPVLKKKFPKGVGIPGRAEALVGKMGQVTVSFQQSQGRVEIGGEDWSARAGGDLPQGSRVKVVGHDGIVLVVEKGE